MRNRTRAPILISFIQHSIRRPHRANRWKRNKSHTNWKERSKLATVCGWHDFIYACVLSPCSHVKLFAAYVQQPTRRPCLWDSPGTNPGIVCHAFLQVFFRSQGSNLCLLQLLNWQVSSSPFVPPRKPQFYILYRKHERFCPQTFTTNKLV